MSAPRVTVCRGPLPGLFNVRYGTPSSFIRLGTLTRESDGTFTAHDVSRDPVVEPNGVAVARRFALSALVENAAKAGLL